MAKSKKGGKLTLGRKSKRGPAGEVNTDGGIKNTVAGKKVQRKAGSVSKAAKTPGATRGA